MSAAQQLLLAKGGTTGDPQWSKVKLYLDFDFGSTNNGSTIVDRSSVGRTFTPRNSPKTTTGGLYGTTLSANLAGADDSWDTPLTTDFDFGSGQFCVEGTFTTTTVASTKILLSCRHTTDNGGWEIRLQGGKLLFQWYAFGSGSSTSATTSLAINTVYDFAICQDGSVCRTFINGAIDNTTGGLASMGATDRIFQVGQENGTGRSWPGRIYRLRATKGDSRHTSAYTPATWAVGP